MPETILSLIVPTKNRPDTLRRLLDSIGSVDGVEAIVIDDGSLPDHAVDNEAVTRTLGAARYLRNAVSLGAPKARNRGAKAARGRFLWFIDDDDEIAAGTLGEVVSRLSEPGTQLAILSSNLISNGLRVSGYRPSSERDNFENYRHHGQLVGTSCILIGRKLFEEVGGWDESIVAGQDTDLMLRLSRMAQPVAWADLAVNIHVGFGPRITNNLWRQQLGKLQILRKHWRILAPRRTAYYLASFLVVMPLIRRLTGRTAAREMLARDREAGERP